MCMHFSIWSRGVRLLKDESMISISVPVVQCSHTKLRRSADSSEL
uniref:Uncharacterized protein n=1 Tax=Arundo donax TaxID=35708 RepID=A0A0A9C4V9_ARUDO